MQRQEENAELAAVWKIFKQVRVTLIIACVITCHRWMTSNDTYCPICTHPTSSLDALHVRESLAGDSYSTGFDICRILWSHLSSTGSAMSSLAWDCSPKAMFCSQSPTYELCFSNHTSLAGRRKPLTAVYHSGVMHLTSQHSTPKKEAFIALLAWSCTFSHCKALPVLILLQADCHYMRNVRRDCCCFCVNVLHTIVEIRKKGESLVIMHWLSERTR